jgi:hypothetical protein
MRDPYCDHPHNSGYDANKYQNAKQRHRTRSSHAYRAQQTTPQGASWSGRVRLLGSVMVAEWTAQSLLNVEAKALRPGSGRRYLASRLMLAAPLIMARFQMVRNIRGC